MLRRAAVTAARPSTQGAEGIRQGAARARRVDGGRSRPRRIVRSRTGIPVRTIGSRSASRAPACSPGVRVYRRSPGWQVDPGTYQLLMGGRSATSWRPSTSLSHPVRSSRPFWRHQRRISAGSDARTERESRPRGAAHAVVARARGGATGAKRGVVHGQRRSRERGRARDMAASINHRRPDAARSRTGGSRHHSRDGIGNRVGAKSTVRRRRRRRVHPPPRRRRRTRPATRCPPPGRSR